MPIYEYHCEPCERDFELLVRSSEEPPACPGCGNATLIKLLSVPASAQSGGQAMTAGPPVMGCGNAQCGPGFCAMNN